MAEISDEIRTRNLKTLSDAGYRDRILVSHDMVVCFAGALGPTDPAAPRKIMPNSKMTHLLETIFPELRRMGMTDSQIDEIIVDNPHRYFDKAWIGVHG